MRNCLLIILLFCGQFILSQSFENIDQIKLYYSIGNSTWGKDGIYSKSEIFELAKMKNGDFKISKQLKIEGKVNGKVFSSDTTFIKTSNYKKKKKNEVENLLTSLNTNEENFTEEFLKQNFTKPTKKEILKTAELYDQKDYFENDYDQKIDIEKKYTQLQQYKYFDEFLEINKPNINGYTITSDAWNSLDIIIVSKEETKSYKLQFFKNCGQPILIDFVEIDKNDKKAKILKNRSSSIINLKVNLILQKILPNNTKLWNVLDLNNIRDEYIVWFLENKSAEFKY